MNCLKFATIRSGKITVSVEISVGSDFSGSSSVDLNASDISLSAKNICDIIKGTYTDVYMMRGPGCSKLHKIKVGNIAAGDLLGGSVEFTNGMGSQYGTYIKIFGGFQINKSSFDWFQGRLNAYGREARKQFSSGGGNDSSPTQIPKSDVRVIVQPRLYNEDGTDAGEIDGKYDGFGGVYVTVFTSAGVEIRSRRPGTPIPIYDEDGNVIGFDPPNPEYVDSTVYSWPIDYTVNVECDIKNYGDD